MDQLFKVKNEVAKGLDDISGVRIDPPGMGVPSSNSESTTEEKKDEGNDSLKELIPTLTKLSLSVQQQNSLLQSIEKKTREDCQVILKDGIWVLQVRSCILGWAVVVRNSNSSRARRESTIGRR